MLCRAVGRPPRRRASRAGADLPRHRPRRDDQGPAGGMRRCLRRKGGRGVADSQGPVLRGVPLPTTLDGNPCRNTLGEGTAGGLHLPEPAAPPDGRLPQHANVSPPVPQPLPGWPMQAREVVGYICLPLVIFVIALLAEIP